jgi:hypothetical protein
MSFTMENNRFNTRTQFVTIDPYFCDINNSDLKILNSAFEG